MSSFTDPSSSLSPYSQIQSETDFYSEVDQILSAPLRVPTAFQEDQDGETRNHAAVFEKLETFVHLLHACYDRFLEQQYNADYCAQRLIATELFNEHRAEMATCLVDLSHRSTTLQALLVSYDLLLAFGQRDSSIYLSLHGDTTSARDKITRLVHQIWAGHYAAMADVRLRGTAGGSSHEEPGWGGAHFSDDEQQETQHGHPMARRMWSSSDVSYAPAENSNAARTRSHQIRLREKAIQLLYEASRVQRLEPVDMRAIDNKFISHLFDLVELTRSHEDEAFNYLLIKLIVALNEQFMVTAISAAGKGTSSGKNTVMTVLKSRLHVTKTFGENLIFMLNRASNHSAEDHCMQLLVLKLLYLLFTTKETAHYFYTNDLKVLVDVFIRVLSDLPEDNESLRHTYLRVLHPLLTNTQLSTTPYKRPQIRRLLRSMTKESLYHGEVSATTRRLVQRCIDAEWCLELDRLDPDYRPPATSETTATSGPASADATTATTRLQPSTVLDAPRFRAVSARSAPNTPPPAEKTATMAADEGGARVPTPAVEEEAAMALADAMTTSERQHEPSWQSQIQQRDGAEDAPEGTMTTTTTTATNGRAVSNSHSEFLSPNPQQQHHHRPIPRRASHNEFRANGNSSSRRRPPPAPPIVASGAEGLFPCSTSTSSGLQDDSSEDTRSTLDLLRLSSRSEKPVGLVLPFLHVDDTDDADSTEATTTTTTTRDAVAAARMTPASSHDEVLTRSVDSLSSNTSDASDGTARSQTQTRQRRPPPAPPTATSEWAAPPVYIHKVSDRAPSADDLVAAREALVVAQQKRRRPPPPPVNRSTKGV